MIQNTLFLQSKRDLEDWFARVKETLDNIDLNGSAIVARCSRRFFHFYPGGTPDLIEDVEPFKEFLISKTQQYLSLSSSEISFEESLKIGGAILVIDAFNEFVDDLSKSKEGKKIIKANGKDIEAIKASFTGLGATLFLEKLCGHFVSMETNYADLTFRLNEISNGGISELVVQSGTRFLSEEEANRVVAELGPVAAFSIEELAQMYLIKAKETLNSRTPMQEIGDATIGRKANGQNVGGELLSSVDEVLPLATDEAVAREL